MYNPTLNPEAPKKKGLVVIVILIVILLFRSPFPHTVIMTMSVDHEAGWLDPKHII